MIYIGIDPGQKGAVAAIDESATVLATQKFSSWRLAQEFLQNLAVAGKLFICIERLWGMPLRGSQGNFSLGGNVEGWKAVIEVNGYSYIEAAPATWQPKILNTSAKKAAETKIASLKYVNKRYPDLKLPMTLKKHITENSGISDAICIALYGRMVQTSLV